MRWEPFDQTALRLASKRVFGRDEVPSHDFAKAKYIVSFGADFLDTWGPTVENQRGFAESHGFSREGGMAKHVYFAPRASLTGLNADEWHGVAPGSETLLALAMAGVVLGERGIAAPAGAPSVSVEQAAEATGLKAEDIVRLAKEFAAARPSLAVAGGIGSQHAGAVELCAAVLLLNYAAGNIGETLLFGSDLDRGDGQAAFAALQQAMEAGQVKFLLVHEANPVYATPKAGKFAEALAKVPFKVSTSLYVDETSSQCDLILPGLHALERWDDAEPARRRLGPDAAGDGAGVPEPPSGRRAARGVAEGRRRLREVRRRELGGVPQGPLGASGPGRRARTPRHSGVRRSPAAACSRPTARSPVKGLVAGAVSTELPAIEGTGDFTLVPYASSLLYDGRGTNKPWLLETPDPVTKITWHAWVELHPDAAAKLDVKEGEILRVTSAHGSIEAPAYIYPGLRPDVVAVPMGFGHTEYGEYAKDRGANYLDLLGPTTGEFVPYLGTKVTVERVPQAYRKVAKTEGTSPPARPRHRARRCRWRSRRGASRSRRPRRRRAIRGTRSTPTAEVEALQGWRDGQVGREDGKGRRLGNYAGEHPMWGMTIDLGKCTGCSACVTACYAENNIPWVGEDQVLRGREISWIRIERYWEGGADGEPVEARFVPMLVPALRQRAVRAGVPGVRGVPHARRPQRAGLQPLRRHALLRQQLPVQGALLQLVRTTRGRRRGAARPAAQPRRRRCARAASWRSAPSACSASAGRSTRRRSPTRRSRTARSSPPARRPARRAPSSSAT